jgi:hypothetical protein
VSLTWGGIKRLVRLQAVAGQLAALAREENDPQLRRVGTNLLSDLIEETQEVLRDSDEELSQELERIVGDSTTDTRSLTLGVRASMLAGWLEGTVAAETLEVRIRTGIGVGRHRSPARVDGD